MLQGPSQEGVDPNVVSGVGQTTPPTIIQTGAPVQTTELPVQTTPAPVVTTTTVPTIINTTPSPYISSEGESKVEISYLTL